MLTKIDKADVPAYRNREMTPLKLFAIETAREFVEASQVGDVCEVTEAPAAMDTKGTQKLANALRDALWRMSDDEDMRKKVRVITRGGSRCFLERVEPWKPVKASKPDLKIMKGDRKR